MKRLHFMRERFSNVSVAMFCLGGAAVLLIALWAGGAYRLQLIRSQRSALESELLSWTLINRYIESLALLNEPAKNLVLGRDPAHFTNMLQASEASHSEIAAQVSKALSNHKPTLRHFSEVHQQSLEMIRMARESAATAPSGTDRGQSIHVASENITTTLSSERMARLNQAYLTVRRGLEKIDGEQRQRMAARLSQSADSLNHRLVWVGGGIAALAAAAIALWLLLKTALSRNNTAESDEEG